MAGAGALPATVTILALGLILGSAVIHASWNLLAKRLTGGAETVWLFTLVSTVLLTPPAGIAIVATGYRPDGVETIFLLGTGVLQTLYFVVLRRGYAVGDLSVVYPLARGTGPLVAVALATLLVGERPSLVTIAGAIIISSGTLLLATPLRTHAGTGAAFGLVTGVIIGSYTVWDGYAVGSLAIPVVVLAWCGDAGRLILLTPVAIGRRDVLGSLLGLHRRGIVLVAVLSTAAYVMVLTAMSIAPISSIAPAREVSIVIGALMGRLILDERGGWRRLLSAAIITAGVVLVALG